MLADDAQGELRECRTCGTIRFGEEGPACCDDPRMEPVDGTPIESPELPLLLRDVFGISRTGLDVCICLMEDGESTVSDIAEVMDLDRSTVARQVNQLVDIGILDKNQRLLRDGGYVYVYTPMPVETVRRRLMIGLYSWLSEAAQLVEEINQEKVKAAARTSEADESAGIYWDG